MVIMKEKELLSAPTTPFTAGLVASIVESASSECLEKQDKLDFKNMPIPPELEQISGAPGYYGEAVSSGITPSTPSNGVSPNSDHLDQYSHATKHVADPTAYPPPTPNDVNMNGLQMVQTQADPTDPLLDDVIDDLVDESELMYTSSKQRADNFDSGMLSEKSAVHETRSTVERPLKSDDDLFKMQQATEDAFAKNMHLPPIPHRPVPRLNGSNTTAKHKLSQPLYFDAVFVPHHGARPLLHDETAAKLFATSIRSKRYILSGKDAIRPYIIDGIMGAKLLWDIPSNMNTQMSVDVVPTHDSTELTGYNMQKASEMSEAGIRLHCSVERCTLKLSSEETNDVCSGFKFEM
ncbi:hypothetical protein AB6A40_004244 [Gnathostoma spinigerum]|uniref:Uncharacterized protein n=1 Tax=Gnathostoma spinigerum TaxID=75299 RepID=A0ABD6EMM6_9BILA